jgi:hypothetical protein
MQAVSGVRSGCLNMKRNLRTSADFVLILVAGCWFLVANPNFESAFKNSLAHFMMIQCS